MRERITRELIQQCGFTMVAVEADWPDAARVDRYVRASPRRTTRSHSAASPPGCGATGRSASFVEWLRRNAEASHPASRVGFHGLDLYSLNTSIGAVLPTWTGWTSDCRGSAPALRCLTPWSGPAALRPGGAVRRLECE